MKYLVHLLAATLIVSGTFPAKAQSLPRPDKYESGSQYLAYPVPERGIPELTPAPEGYEPFHMEHYGRHGSRWLISDRQYSYPVLQLQRADSLGQLSADGKRLLETLRRVNEASLNRNGELTPLGHRQHRGIARRMTKNFPELFRDSVYVDGKSTVVIRCILSMANELTELEKFNPNIILKFDASNFTQSTLNHNKHDSIARQIIKDKAYLYKDYADKYVDASYFKSKVFEHPEAVDSAEAVQLYRNVFEICVNSQSHDGLYDIYEYFSPDELYRGWDATNAYWYIRDGDTPLTYNRTPYQQDALLKNIIESADTAMVSPRQSVNLRFGHESCLLPLTVLMELNDNAYHTEDLTTLAEHWRAYETFPMASNVQMIFYRRPGHEPDADDVLVKVLLNEKEARLPVAPVSGSYYRWSDLRKYWTEKLARRDSLNPSK